MRSGPGALSGFSETSYGVSLMGRWGLANVFLLCIEFF